MPRKKHGRHLQSVMLRVDSDFAIMVCARAQDAGITVTEMTRHLTAMLEPKAAEKGGKDDRSPAKV